MTSRNVKFEQIDVISNNMKYEDEESVYCEQQGYGNQIGTHSGSTVGVDGLNLNLHTFNQIDNKVKCGEIFMDKSCEAYELICIFCGKGFTDVLELISHAKIKHLGRDLLCNKININDNRKDSVFLVESLNTDQIKTEMIEMDVNVSPCLLKEDENNIDNLNTTQNKLEFEKKQLELIEENILNEDQSIEKNKSVRKKYKKREKISRTQCEVCNKHCRTTSEKERHQRFSHIPKILTQGELVEWMNQQGMPHIADENYKENEDEDDDELENKSKKSVDKFPEPAEINPKVCNYCGKTFKSRCTRVNHERIHTGEKPFKCETCGKCYRLKTQLMKHQQIHTGIKQYQCHYCERQFMGLTNLRTHLHIHENIRPFKCDYCDKRFVRKIDKTGHERTHTGEKPYQCPKCGLCFRSPGDLTVHDRKHTNYRPYKCDVCDKGFTKKKFLKNHRIIHTGEKPFKCETCDAAFAVKSSLLIHSKIHSDVLGYVCDVCGKGYKQSSGLYAHKKKQCADLLMKGSTSDADVTPSPNKRRRKSKSAKKSEIRKSEISS